jgi:hypothetical protein
LPPTSVPVPERLLKASVPTPRLFYSEGGFGRHFHFLIFTVARTRW